MINPENFLAVLAPLKVKGRSCDNCGTHHLENLENDIQANETKSGNIQIYIHLNIQILSHLQNSE